MVVPEMGEAGGGAGAIRNLYSAMGVEEYYVAHGAAYRNPHFAEIESVLRQNAHRVVYDSALDFCCGSGEVSEVLRTLGFAGTTACDPYTHKAFERNIGGSCLRWSFKDVLRGRLEGEFSAVICSFAMHLCPKEQLHPLAHALLDRAPLLVVITPHKRPQLEYVDGIALAFEDFALTPRGKKVRLKAYKKLAS